MKTSGFTIYLALELLFNRFFISLFGFSCSVEKFDCYHSPFVLVALNKPLRKKDSEARASENKEQKIEIETERHWVSVSNVVAIQIEQLLLLT